MKSQDIPCLRLYNQHISQQTFKKSVDVVNRLCAVQAQDYFGAKWSLGLRMHDAQDSDIEGAFNDGSILRTHLLRPTWHFVTQRDIRWLLRLTAPQVHKINAHMYRKLELDSEVFKRSDSELAKALQGGMHLTRNELKDVLRKTNINSEDGIRMSYFMMHAELEGIICSGPRRGKQFTYALLDERAPQSKPKGREEALVELTRRYFTSRGPATVHDFAKWSGLTVADARDGLEAVKDALEQEILDGQTYWLSASTPPEKLKSPSAYLLSVYDEYISSYKDRSAMAGENLTKLFNAMGNALQYIIIVDGQFVGTWERTIKKDVINIHLKFMIELSKEEKDAIAEAGRSYGAFLNLPVVLDN